MAVRTKELGNARRNTAGTSNLYTCPAGKTAIVKDVSVSNTGTLTGTCAVELVRSALVWLLFQTGNLAAGNAQHFPSLFIVLEPGDTLRITTTGTSANICAWASGAELAGTA